MNRMEIYSFPEWKQADIGLDEGHLEVRNVSCKSFIYKYIYKNINLYKQLRANFGKHLVTNRLNNQHVICTFLLQILFFEKYAI
jgi:hypothetical protein